MDSVDLEQPLNFDCKGQRLCGILHPAPDAAGTGMLLVVGGPQYRVGSHRQFVLLARHLAANGIPVMRFDYRGMGDSEGELRDFSDVGQDITAAIEVFQASQAGLERIVLWGLCDAASAAAFYGWRDQRVKGLVLLNPWVRTESGEARAYLKHYYLQRLMQKEFWLKLLHLRFKPLASLSSLFSMLRKASASGNGSDATLPAGLSLPQRMLYGLQRFGGPVLLILSGRDLVADEFRDLLAADPAWGKWSHSRSVQRVDMAEADHTFSSRVFRDRVARQTLEWLKTL